jgi:uncharacterized sulfatase
LLAGIAAGLCFAGQSASALDAPVVKKMNVLFIIADDLNCSLGCYGDPVVKSPNVDRLASLGVRFDRAYCNYPVCNASRTSFLSGRYPDTTRVFGNGVQPRVAMGPTVRFLPEYFHDHGYYTASVGKVSHTTFADSVKWDFIMDPLKGEEDDAVDAANKDRKTAKRASKADKSKETEPVPFPWHSTENKDEEEPDGISAAKVASLLEQHKDGPFFIAAGFHKPHVPHVAPKKYFDMYPVDQMPLPIEPTGHAKDIPSIAHPPKYFPDLKDVQKREIISHYHAVTSLMDTEVGVVLAAMDRLKLWDNTVVVFIGDHGWHLGEHDGFWAKMSNMEESARAPMIVAAPGAKAGASSSSLVEFVDIYPTLTGLCGLPDASGVEGLNFAPLLSDPQKPWKKAVFTVVSRGNKGTLGRSIRTDQYTYTEWPDGTTQLYDHRTDAKEYFNLAKDKDSATIAKTTAELKQILKDGPKAAKPSAAN